MPPAAQQHPQVTMQRTRKDACGHARVDSTRSTAKMQAAGCDGRIGARQSPEGAADVGLGVVLEVQAEGHHAPPHVEVLPHLLAVCAMP